MSGRYVLRKKCVYERFWKQDGLGTTRDFNLAWRRLRRSLKRNPSLTFASEPAVLRYLLTLAEQRMNTRAWWWLQWQRSNIGPPLLFLQCWRTYRERGYRPLGVDPLTTLAALAQERMRDPESRFYSNGL